MISTQAIERVGRSPIQKISENHTDISLTFDQSVRDNQAQDRLLTVAGIIDATSDIRRRALVNDMWESLSIMESYCAEDGSRAAFENLNACVRAYADFELRDEVGEDANVTALTGAVRSEIKTMQSAARWSRKITPDCTGEDPSAA